MLELDKRPGGTSLGNRLDVITPAFSHHYLL
jgi:hypothetical protein